MKYLPSFGMCSRSWKSRSQQRSGRYSPLRGHFRDVGTRHFYPICPISYQKPLYAYTCIHSPKTQVESTGAYLLSEHVDEWHHTVLTFEGENREAKIYVDGEFIIEGIVAESVDPSAAPLYIGHKTDDNVYFRGIIDEVRISDVVRTEDEIQEMIKQNLAVHPVHKLPALWGTLKSDHRE